jgi:hypothetical protein
VSIQPFFLELRSAYQSEMDDLTFDSEGQNVLRQRLVAKRKELGFLLQMMAFSPEMVAVVFHQAFVFKQPGVMEMVLGHEADELPDWDTLCNAVELAPWAQPLADTVLKEAEGPRFMTMAAALEYMFAKPEGALKAGKGDDDEDQDEDHDSEGDDERNPLEDDDEDARAREEAGADWLADQGFDRKD